MISYEKTEDDEKERTLSSEMKRDLVVMKSLVESSAPKEGAVITESPEEEELPVPGSGSVVEPTDETADETAAESIPTIVAPINISVSLGFPIRISLKDVPKKTEEPGEIDDNIYGSSEFTITDPPVKQTVDNHIEEPSVLPLITEDRESIEETVRDIQERSLKDTIITAIIAAVEDEIDTINMDTEEPVEDGNVVSDIIIEDSAGGEAIRETEEAVVKEPVVEEVAEAVEEPVEEEDAEAVVEEDAEAVEEPVAEAVTDAVTEPVVEEAVEQQTEEPAEDLAVLTEVQQLSSNFEDLV